MGVNGRESVGVKGSGGVSGGMRVSGSEWGHESEWVFMSVQVDGWGEREVKCV